MSIKPIEVGCMAIIVCSNFPENVGVPVTVVAHDPLDPHGCIWEIEAAEAISAARNGSIEHKIKKAWCAGRQLLRIDGHDPDLLKEWDDLEVIARMKGLHHA